jgi:hypothetical protein
MHKVLLQKVAQKMPKVLAKKAQINNQKIPLVLPKVTQIINAQRGAKRCQIKW